MVAVLAVDLRGTLWVMSVKDPAPARTQATVREQLRAFVGDSMTRVSQKSYANTLACRTYEIAAQLPKVLQALGVENPGIVEWQARGLFVTRRPSVLEGLAEAPFPTVSLASLVDYLTVEVAVREHCRSATGTDPGCPKGQASRCPFATGRADGTC